MPNTVVGVIGLVVLLIPGLVYAIERERRAPTPGRSAFRETATIVFASLLFNLGALGLFTAVRAIAPELTPDVGQLVRSGAGYAERHYREIAGWFALLLAASTGAAFLAGRRLPIGPPRGSAISPTSAWWELFFRNKPPGHTIWVECFLEDGTYLAGELLTYSVLVEESADRELTLRAPITYRAPDATKLVELDAGAVSVSARRINFLGASHVSIASTAPVDPVGS